MKISASGLVIAAAAWIFVVWIYDPYKQNLLIKLSLPSSEISAPAARQRLAVLRQAQPWDPYLDGWGKLAEARTLRALGRNDDSRQMYLDALASRLPHEYWVELGLYEWQLGMRQEAEDHLNFAIQLHPMLFREISNPRLRRELQEYFEGANHYQGRAVEEAHSP